MDEAGLVNRLKAQAALSDYSQGIHERQDAFFGFHMLFEVSLGHELHDHVGSPRSSPTSKQLMTLG